MEGPWYLSADDVADISAAIRAQYATRNAEPETEPVSMRTMVKRDLLKQVAENTKDYAVIMESARMLKLGTLTEEDLAEIEAAIDAKKGER